MPYTADILLTNDDGIYARGLAEMKKALSGLGSVLVVAPDAERSAFGHAITMVNPLRATEVSVNGDFLGVAVDGTPADCVKLAMHTLLTAPPRLVVSGINLGPNSGTHILYSGTVSAAREGTIFDIPSLAVSLRSYDRKSDFGPAAAYTRRFADLILQRGLPAGVMLNINVPALPAAQIKGVRITRMARYRYHDRYDVRQDPRGRTYYWLTGEDAEVLNPGPDVDACAVEEGFVSVTPLHYDLTCQDCLPNLRAWAEEAEANAG
jgi:5'-nucleotidase